eukprot:5884979-Amphidinium_carterae.1
MLAGVSVSCLLACRAALVLVVLVMTSPPSTDKKLRKKRPTQPPSGFKHTANLRTYTHSHPSRNTYKSNSKTF